MPDAWGTIPVYNIWVSYPDHQAMGPNDMFLFMALKPSPHDRQMPIRQTVMTSVVQKPLAWIWNTVCCQIHARDFTLLMSSELICDLITLFDPQDYASHREEALDNMKRDMGQ